MAFVQHPVSAPSAPPEHLPSTRPLLPGTQLSHRLKPPERPGAHVVLLRKACPGLEMRRQLKVTRQPPRGQGQRRPGGDATEGGLDQWDFPSGCADSQTVLFTQHTANVKFAGTYWPKELGA